MPTKPSKSEVEGYIRTLNTSQIYIEIMDPCETGILTPDYKTFVTEQLSERERQNLKIMEDLKYKFLGQFHVRKKKPPRTFRNYREFREHITKRFEDSKYKPMLALEGINLEKCRRIVKDEKKRCGKEKQPYLSKEDVKIDLYDKSDKGFLLFTGLKTRERALEKIAKRLVAAEQEIEELSFPDKKTAKYHLTHLAEIQDIPRMRFILTGGLGSSRQLELIFKALKNNGLHDGKHYNEFRKEPYNHYAFHIEFPEYSPQDDVSLKIMGIPGFFKDLFGERSHPIYEARYSDKVRISEKDFIGLKEKAEPDKDSKIRMLGDGIMEYKLDNKDIRRFKGYMSNTLEFFS